MSEPRERETVRATIARCRYLRGVIADAREFAKEHEQGLVSMADDDVADIAGMLIALETSLSRRSPQGGRKERE